MLIKKIALFAVLATLGLGCGVNKQARQIKALEDCTYKIVSADQILVAGTDVKKLLADGNINLASMPGVALGMLRRDIPLNARINLQITNPSQNAAAINNFEYKVLINSQQLVEGVVNQLISIEPGASVTVPVSLTSNIYPLMSDSKMLNDILGFLQGGAGGPERKGLVTIKIKPSIMVGSQLVKYPGFITIDKEISSKILL
jgi:hypothetical protein